MTATLLAMLCVKKLTSSQSLMLCVNGPWLDKKTSAVNLLTSCETRSPIGPFTRILSVGIPYNCRNNKNLISGRSRISQGGANLLLSIFRWLFSSWRNVILNYFAGRHYSVLSARHRRGGSRILHRGVNPKRGRQPIIWPNFPENCKKIKIGPRKGGRV